MKSINGKPISPLSILYSFRSRTWNQVIALSPLLMMFSIPKYSKFTFPIASTMKFVLFFLTCLRNEVKWKTMENICCLYAVDI